MTEQSSQEKPALSYWHVWTDAAGVSHQTCCELTNFESESMGGDAAPQWNNRLMQAATQIMFAELPAGWVGEWHENPQPQWIIPLSGCWFVETMDGVRVEMGPGDISFGADQNTKVNEAGQKGHLSGTLGEQPAMLMIVQIEDEQWIAAKPDSFE